LDERIQDYKKKWLIHISSTDSSRLIRNVKVYQPDGEILDDREKTMGEYFLRWNRLIKAYLEVDDDDEDDDDDDEMGLKPSYIMATYFR
jgi:hypothetical protein